jgi:hypothetical protein
MFPSVAVENLSARFWLVPFARMLVLSHQSLQNKLTTLTRNENERLFIQEAVLNEFLSKHLFSIT